MFCSIRMDDLVAMTHDMIQNIDINAMSNFCAVADGAELQPSELQQ